MLVPETKAVQAVGCEADSNCTGFQQAKVHFQNQEETHWHLCVCECMLVRNAGNLQAAGYAIVLHDLSGYEVLHDVSGYEVLHNLTGYEVLHDSRDQT